MARTPFISGNSFKRLIRSSASRYALDVMGVESGSLTKGMIHLLFSGGALSGGGAVVKLSALRELNELFPLLGLCGYSAGNHIMQGKLSCDHWHVVCAENAWRLPDSMVDHPHRRVRVGELINDEFGTRHESTRSATGRRLLAPDEAQQQDAELAAALALAGEGKKADKVKDTAQMIYSFESVKAGSCWFGGFYYEDATPLEFAALRSAIGYACQRKMQERFMFSRAAKSSTGYGQMALSFTEWARDITPATYRPDNALTLAAEAGAGEDRAARKDMTDYATHLSARRDDIIKILREASR
jgi:hypothetical protein